MDGIFLFWFVMDWDVFLDSMEYIFMLCDDVIFIDGEKFDVVVVKVNFDCIVDLVIVLK